MQNDIDYNGIFYSKSEPFPMEYFDRERNMVLIDTFIVLNDNEIKEGDFFISPTVREGRFPCPGHDMPIALKCHGIDTHHIRYSPNKNGYKGAAVIKYLCFIPIN